MHFYSGILAAILTAALPAIIGCGGGGGDSPDVSATARCMDGSLSHSTRCADVCAANGGIQQWLASACQASAPGAVSVRAFADSGVTATEDSRAARVEVAWQSPIGISEVSIVEYHIYRDGNIVGTAAARQHVFSDQPELTDTFPVSFDYQAPDSSGVLSTKTGTRLVMSVGVSHTYSVRVVYRKNASLYREGDLLAANGPVSPIARPAAVGPTTDQDLRNISIFYQSVLGADVYTFEFSPDRDFRTKVTRGPFIIQPNVAVIFRSNTFDLSADLPGVVGGTTLYYRVGARSSRDALPPLSRGEPNGDDYIYSVPGPSFTVLKAPPTPPSH